MSKRVAVVAVVAALAVGLVWLSFALVEPSPSWVRPLIAARFVDVRWMDTGTLSRWLDRPPGERPVLIDVRTEGEYAVSHLKHAKRLDPDRPDIASLGLAPEDAVVVYCSVGYRSASIVEDLEQAGVHEVYNLDGGIFQWAMEGRPLVRDGRAVRQVHPYGRVWGRLLRESLRAPLGSAQPPP